MDPTPPTRPAGFTRTLADRVFQIMLEDGPQSTVCLKHLGSYSQVCRAFRDLADEGSIARGERRPPTPGRPGPRETYWYAARDARPPRTARRVGDVLALFDGQEALTSRDVAATLEITLNHAHYFLTSLVDRGVLTRDAERVHGGDKAYLHVYRRAQRVAA